MLLVPCHRPSDALGAIAWHGQRLEAAEICAMLPSWEERFAALPIGADASSITLGVDAPPTTAEQALLLAAEVTAVASPERDVAGTGELLVRPATADALQRPDADLLAPGLRPRVRRPSGSPLLL